MIQLRPYQQECIDTIPHQGSYLIQMATGLGKCFARNTKIMMYDGSVKNVQDVIVGDVIMGRDSQPRTIVSLARGREQMYTIIRKKHDPYTVNESHILSLKITGLCNARAKRITDSIGQTHAAGDIVNISVKDYINCSDTFKHVAKGFCVPVEFKERMVPVDPYFVGLWLGDGNSRRLVFTTEDHEIVEYLQGFANNNGFEFNEVKNSNSGNACDYFLKDYKHNPLRKYFRETLFLNKHIPAEYKINSRDVRLQLLAGLIDTDGSVHGQDKSTVEFCSKYSQMADDVAFIARSLGMTARVFVRHNNKYNKDFYYCCISGNTSEIPTKIKRKQAVNNGNKDNLMHGIKINPAGVGEYYGFEISGCDRMFLLHDCTVAHNTVTFSRIPRAGRMLILSHREELVRQPLKYFDCLTGVEMADQSAPAMAEVVSASVQTMTRRLNRYNPKEFDIVVVDEAHHSAAATYRRIIGHFHPRLLLGFTATPGRSDKVRLDDIYQDIVFKRDLRWGIQNNYLSDIYCRRVSIGYDLSRVRSRMGDYAPGELEEAMDGTSDAIAQAYRDLAVGATLIFAVSVKHANDIAAKIPGAVVVTGETQDRARIVQEFTDGRIPCIVSVMVFTEGTDIPRVETIIIARPTQSDSLYTQMVGRGLRIFPGKARLNLIDCVGITGRASLCTAPSLLGIDISEVPERKQGSVQGPLFDLPDLALRASDCPESWIKNIKIVDLWAQEQKYQTHDVNWFKLPDGSLLCSLPERQRLLIPCPDELGRTNYAGTRMDMQAALDAAYRTLTEEHADSRAIWDKNAVERWGKKPASDKQLKIIKRRCKGFDPVDLTAGQASMILNRVLGAAR